MKHGMERRTFLETAGASAGLGGLLGAGCATVKTAEVGMKKETGLRGDITALVNATPFVDTHEHLCEESHRIRSKTEKTDIPAPDLGILFSHYSDSDLQVSGMPPEDYQRLRAWNVSPKEKWKLVAPYYARCRHTGYQQCVRESIRALYGEDDIREDNCEAISEKIAAQIAPGFYNRLLKEAANLEYCQVNALDVAVFRKSAQPELLAQDLWTIGISSGINMKTLTAAAEGAPVKTLEDVHAVIDHCFDTYGPRAIAVKDQCAYARALQFDPVTTETAAPIFTRFAQDEQSISATERKALQDHLFRRCLAKAEEHHLPVKLHTGYYAGHNGMPLGRVRDNASDLCALAHEFPHINFVLMHIDYPYQDELIAMTKHYKNVYADMCWAWIINPAASVRFLKEFLMAAPAHKVFTFGGDYIYAELVPGHAQVARRGLAQAISELVEENWLAESEAPALVDRIMRGNAHETFDYARAFRNCTQS